MNQQNHIEIKYPYLPEGQKIQFVSIDNHFIQEAKNEARKHSTDSLQPTGAVIVQNDKIIGRGANHTFLGKNKTFNKVHQKGLCLRKILHIPSGHGYWICPGCVTNSNHAEPSAIRDAEKNGQQIINADLYLWGHWWSCEPCWQAMIKAGIRNVYLANDSHILFQRGVTGNIIGRQFNDN